MSYLATLPLMAALRTRLEALTLTDADPAKAFEAVRFSAKRDSRPVYNRDLLLQTLADEDVVADTFCLVFPTGDAYTTTATDKGLQIERFSKLTLYIGARDYTVDTGQLLDRLEGPSVLTLKDRVVASLTGERLGFPAEQRVRLLPVQGELHQFGEDDGGADRSGLAAWEQVFQTSCGITLVAGT